MEEKEILKFCSENGILLDDFVLSLVKEADDPTFVKAILEKVKIQTRQSVITKSIFVKAQNLEGFFLSLPEEHKKNLEKLKINLGLSIEISREVSDVEKGKFEKKINLTGKIVEEEFSKNPVQILSRIPFLNKKLEVSDFVRYFRNRFSEMKKILQEHTGLNNLVSINKIYGNQQGISVIGIVYDKRVTKNKNIIFEIEDPTGKMKVLINLNRPELYSKAEEVTLDSVIAFRGSGSREILFANEIIFPDSSIPEKKKSSFEEHVAFIGDLHFGSKLFMEKNFLKFIDYTNGKILNSVDPKKIKYLFIVGDLVTGVGNYPDQERDLKIKDLEEQYLGFAKLLSAIRKDITLIISPGNHDGVRLMEPQPPLDEKYAWPLYDLPNAILTTNPCMVNIGARKGFDGFNVLTYHGFSFPFYADNILSLAAKKAMNVPNKIMEYLLKNRHLAPTHSSVQYFPFEEDFLMVKQVPDIFVSGHSHKSAVSYYNNILVISNSSWEGKTAYQEKFGNEPDHCKVPVFNLKTSAVKILDFEDGNSAEEIKEWEKEK